MSSESRSYRTSGELPTQLGRPSTLSMPEKWTLSTPWKRARRESDHGGPINDLDQDDTIRVLRRLEGLGYVKIQTALPPSGRMVVHVRPFSKRERSV